MDELANNADIPDCEDHTCTPDDQDCAVLLRGALGAGQCTFLLRRLEEAGPLSYREPRGHDGGNAASCGGVEGGVQRGGGIPAAARARLKRKLVQRLSGAIVSAASGF